MAAISRRLAGSLATDVVLASTGAAIQRATPIVLGAVVLWIAGDEALHAHNVVYVAITLCGVMTASGLAPHILRKRSDPGGQVGGLAAESLAFTMFFVCFAAGYASLIWRGTVADFIPLVLAMYFYSRMLIGLAVFQSQRRYRRTLSLQLSFTATTMLVAVLLMNLGVSRDHIFGAAYLAGSIPMGVALYKLFPFIPKITGVRLTRNELVEIGNYTFYGILSTGLTFLILNYLNSFVNFGRFNQLIFCYQLYAFLIFVPSMLTVVVVPHTSGDRAGAGLNRVFLFYGLAATVLVGPLVLFLPLLFRLYGLEIDAGWTSLAAILLSAIPSSMTAGLNQMNIVRRKSHIPLLASGAAAFVILALLATFVSAADFGYALLGGASTSFLVSAALTFWPPGYARAR